MELPFGAAMMICLGCGKNIERRADGAWPRCCGRLDYQSELAPLPRDAWYPTPRKGKLHIYGWYKERKK